MKTFKQLKQHLDSRPAFNNPKDNDIGGWDNKEIKREKESTIYGRESVNLKDRMQRAYKRNKRQKKIDRLQSTSEWPGLELFQKPLDTINLQNFENERGILFSNKKIPSKKICSETLPYNPLRILPTPFDFHNSYARI